MIEAQRLARRLVRLYGKKRAKAIARMRLANARNQPELKELYKRVVEILND